MAISVLQRTSGIDTSGATGSIAIAYGSNNTAGSASIVVITGSDTTESLWHTDYVAPTDSRNTYVKIFDQFARVYGVGMKVYIAYNIGAGANTVTLSNDGNNPTAMYIYEVAGLATSAAFDKFNFHTYGAGTSSFDSLATATTTNSNELLLGAVVAGLTAGETWTAGGSFVNIQQNNNASGLSSATEELVVSSTGTTSATFTTTSATQGGLAAIFTFSDTAITPSTAIVTHLGSTYNTTTGTHTLVTTPKINDLIVIVRANTGNTTSTAPTDNNSSGTYTLITSALKATSADLMEIYIRTALIGSATSTTFSDAAGTTTGGGLSVFSISGITRTGASAAKQNAVQANQAAAGTPTPVFGSAVLTNNPVIGAVFNASNQANILPRGTPWYTRWLDEGFSTPTTGITLMSINSGETGTSMAWGATSASAFCDVIIELDTSSSATVPSPSQYLKEFVPQVSNNKPIITEY